MQGIYAFYILYIICLIHIFQYSPGNQGWGGTKSANRNSTSVLDADITSTTPNVLKPSAGRVIRIVNNLDHNVQVGIIDKIILYICK